MSGAVRQVCDGWDVTETTVTGQRVTLHFVHPPEAADIAAALAAWEAAQLPAEPPPVPEYEIECEDGSYA